MKPGYPDNSKRHRTQAEPLKGPSHPGNLIEHSKRRNVSFQTVEQQQLEFRTDGMNIPGCRAPLTRFQLTYLSPLHLLPSIIHGKQNHQKPLLSLATSAMQISQQLEPSGRNMLRSSGIFSDIISLSRFQTFPSMSQRRKILGQHASK